MAKPGGHRRGGQGQHQGRRPQGDYPAAEAPPARRRQFAGQNRSRNAAEEDNPHQLADLQVGWIQKFEAVRSENQDGKGEKSPLRPVQQRVSQKQGAAEPAHHAGGNLLPSPGQKPDQAGEQHRPGQCKNPGDRGFIGAGLHTGHPLVNISQSAVQAHQHTGKAKPAEQFPQPIPSPNVVLAPEKLFLQNLSSFPAPSVYLTEFCLGTLVLYPFFFRLARQRAGETACFFFKIF